VLRELVTPRPLGLDATLALRLAQLGSGRRLWGGYATAMYFRRVLHDRAKPIPKVACPDMAIAMDCPRNGRKLLVSCTKLYP
jgi:hypothetical protein